MELADNCFTSIQFIIDNFPNLERLQLSTVWSLFRSQYGQQYRQHRQPEIHPQTEFEEQQAEGAP